MAEKMNAYRSSTGAIFATREEANMDEIREAVERIDRTTKDDLIGIAAGRLIQSEVTDAIRHLSEAIDPRPTYDAKVA